jgi:phospholipid/cholesterol/gamma-HCH transport system substrate-binding protein
MKRRTQVGVTILLLGIAGVGASVWLGLGSQFGPKTITAEFSTATAIYPGDDVRVAGIRVGTIESITPEGAFVRLKLALDRDIPVPADAQAVIVAPNLVSARYVQLTPAYESSGPTMADGAHIPNERTAAPVEWDEVKTQLTRLATELGPTDSVSDTPAARFIDSAADAMAGNGDKLRQTLTQLSGVGRILTDGGGDIVEVIENLQTFITTLRDSTVQIVQFQDRLATLTSVLDGSKSDLDGALTNVAEVLDDVQRFVVGTRDQATTQVQQLAEVTQTVVEQQRDLEQILHVAPTAVANTLNMFDPRDGGANGIVTLNNFSNPLQFLCGAIGGIENTTAPETAKRCAQYLGPAVSLLNFNYLPFPFNPVLNSVPPPEDLVYTEPGLMPGGTGPKPGQPETPPAVSAYTGPGGMAFPSGNSPSAPSPAGLEELMLPPQVLAPIPPSPPLAAESPDPTSAPAAPPSVAGSAPR